MTLVSISEAGYFRVEFTQICIRVTDLPANARIDAIVMLYNLALNFHVCVLSNLGNLGYLLSRWRIASIVVVLNKLHKIAVSYKQVCIILYYMVWYGMVRCVWCVVVWYSMIRYGMVRYSMIRYGMVRYSMVLCIMVLYGAVLYGMVWYGVYFTVMYSIVQCSMIRNGMYCVVL